MRNTFIKRCGISAGYRLMNKLRDLVKMDKKNIKLAVTTFLIVIFFFFVFTGINKGRKENRVKVSKETDKTAYSEKKRDFDFFDSKFNKIEYKRNPFEMVPVKLRGGSRSGCLEGIVWDSSRSTAIFGDRFFKAGDNINGYKILRIKNESVILSNRRVIYELKLGESLKDLNGASP